MERSKKANSFKMQVTFTLLRPSALTQSTQSSLDMPDKPGENKNVRRRAAVKFNQMSGEKVKMSGEAKKNFVYTVNIRANINDHSLISLDKPRSPERVYSSTD